jgi:hypothetical protein
MKNVTLIICLVFLTSCASTKLSLTNSSECTNCRLERIEFWNRWLAVCAPGNKVSSTSSVWSKTKFCPVGVTYEGFKTKDSLNYLGMVNLYKNLDTAKEYLPSIICSGSNYPQKAKVNKGEYLIKIVKVGDDISSESPYYITPKEFKRLKMKPSRIEQELALPLTSNAGIYLVYRIHALADNVVFQSHVAPTVQYHLPSEAVYWNTGGATQTLVINNFKTEFWTKETIPSDTLKIQTLPNINQRQNLKE